MEWNWLSGNNMTPFSLYESTGDSEEVKSYVHHDHEQDEEVMDEQEGVGVSLRFDEDEVDDDDAHSCSYDHSSYINTRYGSNNISQHDQSQKLIYYDDYDDDDDGDIDDDDDDDNDNKNQYQTKLMDTSKQQWRAQKSCVEPLNQREIDRKFWETCLAS